jgi:hypothetical protein
VARVLFGPAMAMLLYVLSRPDESEETGLVVLAASPRTIGLASSSRASPPGLSARSWNSADLLFCANFAFPRDISGSCHLANYQFNSIVFW